MTRTEDGGEPAGAAAPCLPTVAGSAAYAASASASPAASSASKSAPVVPGSTSSALPPWRVATTGLPSVMYSAVVRPKASIVEGVTQTSAASM